MGKSNRVLPVNNIHRSIQFYTDVLGLSLQEVTDDPNNRLTWAILLTPGNRSRCVIGFTQSWSANAHVAQGSGHMVPVEDVKHAALQAKYFGGEVLSLSPSHVVVKDPDGYVLNLIEIQQQSLAQAA